MIIIFASFLIFLLLTGSNSLIIWGSDSVKTSMQALFNCEARGKVDGLNCSRDSSFNSSYTIIDAVNGVVRFNLPVLFTIFLLDFKSVKKNFGKNKMVSKMSTKMTLVQSSIRSSLRFSLQSVN